MSDQYRYRLTRHWIGGRGQMCFVMLNPSTADEIQDDPTIRRVVRYAQREGFERLVVVNLFAYRATSPRDLAAAFDAGIDIVGAENDDAIAEAAGCSKRVIAAWGANPCADLPYAWTTRSNFVANLVRVRKGGDQLWCLGLTRSGAPRHPLYLSKTAPLVAMGAGG